MTIPLTNPADPRPAPYRDLKDRDLVREGNLFIAEGDLLVRRLLESGLETLSILASDQRLHRIAAFVPQNVPLYVAPAEIVNQIIGFKFHSGVMAVGRRPPSPTFEQIIPSTGRCLLAICPEIANTENLGVLIRIAAAFAVNALILGENCCDPFYRQSIRVSMGNVFRLPIVRSADLAADLDELAGRWHIQRFATILDASAECLSSIRPPPRAALLFGNEAQGLSEKWLAHADRRITIPMPAHVDSLNVAVAAGIFLHHFSNITPSTPASAE
jgi:tRNA G18 (ribose-2'-O)-methylase SpoU